MTARREGRLYCDSFGCIESHPLSHELLGDECFGTGRWLGWVYIDLNRPDLYDRELRFCSVQCCAWWLDQQIITKDRVLTPLDKAIRAPRDEVARKLAGLHRAAPVPADRIPGGQE